MLGTPRSSPRSNCFEIEDEQGRKGTIEEGKGEELLVRKRRGESKEERRALELIECTLAIHNQFILKILNLNPSNLCLYFFGVGNTNTGPVLALLHAHEAPHSERISARSAAHCERKLKDLSCVDSVSASKF